MSKDSKPAQPELDLSALSDALGDEGNKADAAKSKPAAEDETGGYLIGGEDDEAPSKADKKDASKEKPAAATAKPPAGAAKGTGSPQTLSPSSMRSLSPTPAANPTSRPTQNQQQPDSDGTADGIKAMFPTIDLETIHAVLAAEDGNPERAVNVLLQMSDPSYKPPSTTAGATEATASDEALARHLFEEERARAAEEERQRSSMRMPSGRGGSGFLGFGSGGATSAPANEAPSYDPQALNYQAYQPRVRRGGATQQHGQPHLQQQQAYGQRPASGERQNSASGPWPGPEDAKKWQEDINRLAETGMAKAASTFSMLRQKGTAAWQELQASQAQGQQQGQQAQAQGGGGGASAAPTSGRGGGGAASFFSGLTGGAPAAGRGGRGGGAAGAGAPPRRSSSGLSTGSGNRGFDADPAPVGEDELARILARGRTGGNGANKAAPAAPVKDDLYGDEEEEELGWESAGRTKSSGAKGGPGASSAKGPAGDSTPAATERNEAKPAAAATTTSSTTGGATKTAALGAGVGAAAAVGAGTAAAAVPAAGAADGSDDSELDDEPLENPFEDED